MKLIFKEMKVDISKTMNRRNFLNLSKLGIVLAAVSPLYALTPFLELDDFNLRLIQDDEACVDALVGESDLQHKKGDIIASLEEKRVLYSLHKRLYRLQKIIGYAHFNVIDFDKAIKTARAYSKIGSFSKKEINYFEELFYESAQNYGFFGKKVISNMTNTINNRNLIKIRRTGHYLFRGDSLKKYNEIRKVMGRKIILTSGVRNIVKQSYLFLNKVVKTKGNLSIASRSLAPAGYSYHGISDFDIGKIGFGIKNFTSAFAQTREFRNLTKLGYISIRYPKNNPFGVRYEPWHIKVHSDT